MMHLQKYLLVHGQLHNGVSSHHRLPCEKTHLPPMVLSRFNYVIFDLGAEGRALRPLFRHQASD